MNPVRAKWSLPTFVLVAGLSLELYFLLGDIPIGRSPASSMSPTTPPIGELVGVRNSVRLQNEGELVWDEGHSKQILYRRQSVLTLEASGAEVAFLDGTGIMIDEKSLVLLEKSPGDDPNSYSRIVVRLLHGTLRKAAPRKTSDVLRRMSVKTPKFEIETGNSRLELSPASELTVTSLPNDPEGSRITVQSGEVRAETPNGSITVKQGEEARLPKEGSAAAPTSRKLQFSLLSPKSGQTIEAQAGQQPVRFRWNVLKEVVAGHPQEIEVSGDPEFKSGVVRTRIPAAEPPLEYVEVNVALSVQNAPVRWFWRVRTVGQGATPPTASAPEQFWIQPQPLPVLLHPSEHAQFAFGKPIDLSWEPFDEATSYEVEISGRPSIQTKESFARIERLPVGTSPWRVRARLADGSQTEWSVPRELAIVEAVPEAVAPTAPVASAEVNPSAVPSSEPAPPPPPSELEEPVIDPGKHPAPRHTFWNWLIPAAYAEEDAEKWIVHLKWKAVTGAKGYKVQISREKSFKSVLTQSETTKPEWDWDFKLGMENEQGRAYFRVASVSAGGKIGTFSKPKLIKISKAILASSKYRGATGAQEVYDAKDESEGAQPIGAADAAPRSDLESIARPKIVQSADIVTPAAPLKPLIGPKVAPKLDAQIQVENPSSEVAAPPDLPTPGSWSVLVNANLGTGYGSMDQSTKTPELTGVRLNTPYVQQKITASVLIAREESVEESAVAWMTEAQFWMAGFKAANAADASTQATVRALGFRVNAYRSWENLADPWRIFVGLTLDHSYRWIGANDAQAVNTSGALSLGPSARAVRTYDNGNSLFSIRETGLALDLPATGWLTRGQSGAGFRIWGEWNLASFFAENALNLRLRTEAEASYFRWQRPNDTATFSWTFWVAPALVF